MTNGAEGLLIADHERAAKTIVIKPPTGWMPIDLKELWEFKQLLFFLAARDIKVKYKQTFLGVLWAVLQPLTYAVLFTFFFGRLAKIPSEGQPYGLFSFAGLVVWTYFQTALSFSSTSLVDNKQLVSKIYFPRLILPSAATLAGLVDFLFSFCFLLLVMKHYHAAISLHILWAIPFIAMAVATALAAGLWLSAINVQFRDVQYAIPFLVQVWLFASPVVYPASMAPGYLRVLYGLNPMAGVIEGFKWAVLPNMPAPNGGMMIVSVLTVIALLIGGVRFFQSREKRFADVV